MITTLDVKLMSLITVVCLITVMSLTNSSTCGILTFLGLLEVAVTAAVTLFISLKAAEDELKNSQIQVSAIASLYENLAHSSFKKNNEDDG